MKKNIIITVALVALCIMAKAQTFKASYEYDANGNRTKAYVIYLQTSLKSAKLSLDSLLTSQTIHTTDTIGLPKQGWDKGFTDTSGEFTASVYPNPTHGILIIELVSTQNISVATNSIKVRNIHGAEVYVLSKPNAYNSLNFSSLATGTYLITITLNGTVKQYKVIKN